MPENPRSGNRLNSFIQFFDPTEYSAVQIPMYGVIHLLTVLVMLLLVLAVLWKRDSIRRLANNRRFVVGFISVYMGFELFYWLLLWVYSVDPLYERFPLHLCASLSILVPVLILMERNDLLRFFSYWTISAGFISFVNPGFVFEAPVSFAFIHYLIRHYLLFLLPVILQIGRDYKHHYREFTISWLSLGGWAFLIFLVDWATGANYMHLGRNNPLEIPFLPSSFTVWPYSFPSFVGVGIILLHIAYFSFSRMHRGNGTEKVAM